MVQTANRAMMPQLRALWKTCFGDEEGYLDLVFGKLIRPERAMVIADGEDRVLAMLFWHPAPVCLGGGQPVRGAYVYGVATDPQAQGKGLSTRLMEGLHSHLQGLGVALSALVPAGEGLFRFYAARGYETAFSYRKVSVEGWQIPGEAPGGVLSAVALEQLEALRGRQFAGSGLFVAWEREWLRYTGLENRFLGGEVLRYSYGGAKGYAVCVPWKDKLVVKELGVEPEALNGLLHALHARYGKSRYELRLSADFSSSYPGVVLPFGMVRWYDREKEQLARQAGGSSPWLAFGLD